MSPGVLIAFLAYAVFAVSDASIKLIGGALPTYQVAFAGAVLGFVVLPFVRGKGESILDMFRTVDRRLWIARAIAMTFTSLAVVVAFTRLPMPEAFALIFLMPLFVTVLSVVFLKEEVGPWRWAAVAIGFLGVLIVLRPGFRTLDIGHLAAIVCGLSGAVSIVIYRHLGTREKRISLFGAGLIGPLAVNGLLVIPVFTVPTPAQAGLLLSYGLLAAIAQVMMMMAAKRAPASAIAPPQYSQMIWAVAFTYFVFDQPVDALTFVGIGVIIAAGLLTWLREKIRLPRERRVNSIWSLRRARAGDRDAARR